MERPSCIAGPDSRRSGGARVTGRAPLVRCNRRAAASVGPSAAIGDGVEELGREQVASTTDLLTIALVPQTAQRLDGVMVGRTVMRSVAQAQVHAAVSPATILLAAVASVGVGLSFGRYPALRAGRLSPIDAIRHE